MKLNAGELRDIDEDEIKEKLKHIKRRPIYFILDNIYDTYNIGGLFRLADALAIEKIYICGESEIQPNSRIKKASIGTYKVVPWEYCKTAEEAIRRICITYNVKRITNKKDTLHATRSTLHILAVEQSKDSIPYVKADYSFPLALIFGNETSGVSEETLKLCDQIVEIPMWGINKSLNVIVSAAIVSYHIVNRL